MSLHLSLCKVGKVLFHKKYEHSTLREEKNKSNIQTKGERDKKNNSLNSKNLKQTQFGSFFWEFLLKNRVFEILQLALLY